VAAACAPLNLIGRSFSHPPGRCARHSAEGLSWVFRGHFGTIIALYNIGNDGTEVPMLYKEVS